MNSKKLKEMILGNKFNQARNLLLNYRYEKLSRFLGGLANETENEIVYKFVQYLIEKEEIKKRLIEYHIIASTILSIDIPYLSYSFEKAIFHAKEAIKLNPEDTSLKEHLLFIYEDPNAKNFMHEEEAEKIAKEVLKVDPENRQAKTILKDLKRENEKRI